MNENNVEELDKLKTELCDIRQEKLKGNIIRPRTEYIDKGEKNKKKKQIGIFMDWKKKTMFQKVCTI